MLKRPIMCYIFEKQAHWGYKIWYWEVTTWWPLGPYLVTSWWPLGDYLVTTWWLLGDFLVTTWWPLCDHCVTTWWPLVDHFVTTWWLLGDYLVTTWWLFGNHWWSLIASSGKSLVISFLLLLAFFSINFKSLASPNMGVYSKSSLYLSASSDPSCW